jgi:uncharacterized protein
LLLQLALGAGIAWWRLRHAHPDPAVGVAKAAVEPTPGAWPGWREFRVVRRVYEDGVQSQCSFYLEAVDGVALPPFKPGQFLTFQLPVADHGEPRTIIRCYSLSDRPAPTGYRVTIKRVPAPADRPALPPGVSSAHFHDQVHEGDMLRVKAPSGHFHIDPDAQIPAVLIAGGIGITPMMSMLRWCLDEQPARVVHLYYGVRQGGEQAFKPLLEQLARAHPNLHLNVVYSRPGGDDVLGRDYQHLGHIDIDLLRRTLPHGRHQFYVCGPAAMMESLVPAILHWGVPRQDLHYEAFGPASIRLGDTANAQPAAAVAEAIEVRFERSRRTLVWDGRDANLLEFAERHGVAADSGCRAGGCGSCETRLIAGTVHYNSAPDHDVAPGHCLLCVGQPASTLTLEA